MDFRAFSGELVWFAPSLGEWKQSREHFAYQPCGRSIRPCIFRMQKCSLQLLLRVQECRSPPPQDAGMILLSTGDGILTHLP
jgi:hypothetical protein